MQIIETPRHDEFTEDLYMYPHQKLMGVASLLYHAGHEDDRECFDQDELLGISQIIGDAANDCEHLFRKLAKENDSMLKRIHNLRLSLATLSGSSLEETREISKKALADDEALEATHG